MFPFENLRIYQDSRELVKELYALLPKFPAEEKFALGNQLRRCATSIILNIAEGSCSCYPKEFSQFLNVANRSLGESTALLQICLDLSFIGMEEYQRLYDRLEILSRQINSLRILKINYGKSHTTGQGPRQNTRELISANE